MNQGAYVFSLHYLLQIAYNIHIEHIDGQIVFLAHGGGGEVHYLESASVNLVVGNLFKLGGGGVFLWVGGVDAIHTGAFQHHICFNFNAAQTGTRVGGEVGATCTSREDTYIAYW